MTWDPQVTAGPSTKASTADDAPTVETGELPNADTVSAYEEVLPGSADRILRMLEQHAQHRMTMEQALVAGASRTELLGQLFGSVIVVLVLTVATWLISQGHELPGTLIALADLGVLIGVYVRRDGTGDGR